MANPTTNYGFVMPTSTDLVTDLPADFGVFGQAVDTQMFTNASAAIAKTIVDAKGDIIAATAADTVSRLAVGANDTVLTADSTTATGLKWATPASSGSLTLLSTTTMSGVSTTISSISQAYEQLYIVIYGVTYSTAAANFRMNLNGNTTNNLVMTNYANTNASTVTGHANNPDYRLTNQSPQLNTSANNLFLVTIYNYTSSTGIKTMNGVSNYLNSSSFQTIQTTPGFYNATTAVTSITFEQSNGASATAGTIKIYGVK